MSWLTLNWPMVLDYLASHLWLSLPAIVASFILAVPLGWLGAHHPHWGRVVTTAASLLYTIPALPLLIVIPVIFNTPLRSPLTVIIALTIYGTALMTRTAADAFGAIDPNFHDVAIAMGYAPLKRFFQIELPIAAPILLGGMRVVAVSTIGLVTIGALVGIPSLGSLLTDGFQRGIIQEVATGIVLTMVVALVLDRLLGLSQRILMPWTKLDRPGESGP